MTVPDVNVELARISYRQAVAVALIGAIAGVVTTLLSKSVIQSTGDVGAKTTQAQAISLQTTPMEDLVELRRKAERYDQTQRDLKEVRSQLTEALKKQPDVAAATEAANRPANVLRDSLEASQVLVTSTKRERDAALADLEQLKRELVRIKAAASKAQENLISASEGRVEAERTLGSVQAKYDSLLLRSKSQETQIDGLLKRAKELDAKMMNLSGAPRLSIAWEPIAQEVSTCGRRASNIRLLPTDSAAVKSASGIAWYGESGSTRWLIACEPSSKLAWFVTANRDRDVAYKAVEDLQRIFELTK